MTLAARLASLGDRPAWDRFVAATAAGDPLQAWAWGEVAATGSERPLRLLAEDADGIAGVCQLLLRRTVAGRQVLYAPHGPLWARGSADEALDTLLRAAAEVGRNSRGIVLKVDPRATFERDASGVAAALEGHGLHRSRHDLQARTTAILDLAAGEDALLASFEKDARNAIRRSAREGVVVDVSRTAAAEYDAFAELLAQTGARAGFRTRSRQALACLGREFGASGDAYLALARLGDRLVAGCLVVATGPRAFYLYAGSLRDHELRHAFGSYAALWGVCRALIADGRASLDLWGVVPAGDASQDASWQGFSLFKRGFRGTPLEHPGTFDLELSPLWNRVRDLRERLIL